MPLKVKNQDIKKSGFCRTFFQTKKQQELTYRSYLKRVVIGKCIKQTIDLLVEQDACANITPAVSGKRLVNPRSAVNIRSLPTMPVKGNCTL